jgi:hypothetical protein
MIETNDKQGNRNPDPQFLTPAELAARWRTHPSTIRRRFREMPGVLKFANDKRRHGTGEYIGLRIPLTLVLDLERKLAA